MNASPKPSPISAPSTPTPSSRSTPEGRLVLVVGPSGVGKDTLIAGAKAALVGESVVFPRREITRPPGDGEDNVEVSEAEFELRRSLGDYALSWRAHELGYGVPARIAQDLAVGRTVVVNVSRGVLGKARARFGEVRVVSVTASLEMLRKRLTDRHRETAEQIEARLTRAFEFVVEGPGVVTVTNDGTQAEGVAALVAAIRP